MASYHFGLLLIQSQPRLTGRFLVSPLVNPVVLMLVIVGFFAWMLLRPKSSAPLKILLLLIGWMLYGPVSSVVMNAEAGAFPKFDYPLYLVDKALGVSAFSIARHFSEWHLSILSAIYMTLVYWMVAWYAMNLMSRNGRPRELLKTFLLGYSLAPLFFLVVPACGPRYAFGDAFPLGNPDVGPVRIVLNEWPNCIPSLHFATAIFLVCFSGRNRLVRFLAWVFMIGTAAATIAFEHYLIDLIVAIPYACFVIRAVERSFASAFRNVVIVLAWLFSIRLATPLIVGNAWALRFLALATIAAGAINLLTRAGIADNAPSTVLIGSVPAKPGTPDWAAGSAADTD